MKTKYKINNCFIACFLLVLVLVAPSCTTEEEAGVPSIEYIRYTTAEDPVSYANLGQMIAIIGENLSTVKQVSFNGYPGVFKTTMVSDNNIVVTVSDETPFLGSDATNEVKVVTDGGEATATLEIAPPAPELTAISPAYAAAGAEVVISGSYFYNISEVYFGEKQAQIIDVTPDAIVVKVPVDYTKSTLKVISSKSGEGVSEFAFGVDDGAIQLNWGDTWPANGGWWNSSSDGPNDDFSALNMTYKYVEGTFGPTWWTLDGGINFDANDARKGNPALKALEFEYALIGDSPWIQFLFKSSLGEHKFICKDLMPTAGKWSTYSIPMTTWTLGDGGPAMTQEVFESDDPLLLQYALVNAGTTDLTIKLAMTNFRIVEK